MSTILEHAKQTPTRDMPNNLEAEQSVLGAVLSNNEALLHVSSELKPEHFYANIHQRIYEAILQNRVAGKVSTPVTLKKHFDAGDPIEGKYLARLVASASSITNIHDYSHEIVDLYMQRYLIKAAENVIEAGLNGKNSTEMSEIAVSAISFVTAETSFKQMRNSRETALAIVESFSQPPTRISTHIARLDKALGGGFRPGQVYAVAARPGSGKTMIAGTISHNLNHSGVKHLFICAEMGDEEIHSRSVARSANCTVEALDEMRTHATYCATRDPGNVVYQSDSFLTFEALKTYVLGAVNKHKITGFILDYFQLVRGVQKGGNLVFHLEEVAQWIAAICKKHQIWGLVLSQMNKEGGSRWGDSMEMAFTNLFYLHRVNEAGEADKTSNLAWLEMEKCRHTKFMHVGSAVNPSLIINGNGPYFEEHHTAESKYSATLF